MTYLRHGKSIDLETHACGCVIESFESGARSEKLCTNHQMERAFRALTLELTSLRREVNASQRDTARCIESLRHAVDRNTEVQYYRPTLWRRLVAFVVGRKM